MKLDGEEALEHLELFPELLEDSNSKFISLREVAACAESLLGIGYDSVYCILDENGVMQYVNAEFCEVFNLPGTSIGMLLESFSYASLVRTMNDCSLDNNAVPVACVWLPKHQKIADAADDYTWYLKRKGRVFSLYGMCVV
jgi:hypothetical protein